MSPYDLPRWWRAALTFHPDIRMFGGKRGAWRVHHCFTSDITERTRIRWYQADDDAPTIPLLYMDVVRPLKDGVFVNPTKLLRELLTERRLNALKMMAPSDGPKHGGMMSTDTQRDQILKHLMACNSITPLEALHHFKCMRLGARIWELRQPKYGGHPIQRRMKAMSSGKIVAEYSYDFGAVAIDREDAATLAQGAPAC